MKDESGGQGAGLTITETRFARAGDVSIGYQVVGNGPIDVVWAWGSFSNIEVMWEEPSFAAFLRRLSEFSRLILFDRRGCGISDRGGRNVTPTLEERMEDIIAVLDKVGSERASIFGVSEGGNLAALFAATYPERTRSIILYGTPARYMKDDDHPWGYMDLDGATTFLEGMRRGWGLRSELAVQLWAPSMLGDERFTEWMAKYARQSVSRDAIVPLSLALTAYDLADVFPAVRVPTLILHRSNDQLVPVAQSRRISQEMPNASYIEMEGIDHFPFIGDAEAVLAEVENFLVGSGSIPTRSRRLVTVAFTDVVESTGRLDNIGDDSWRELIAAHDRVVRDHLARLGGQEIKQLGDGFLMIFEGPARAIRCILGIMDGVGRLGLSVRAGLHTGECEIVGSDVQGIAVHVARRITDLAEAGQILASNTLVDLVAGSGIRFGNTREVELEGIAGKRSVSPVLVNGANPDAARRLAIDRESVLRRDGEYWTVAYDGMVVALRDSKGLRDIARLLSSPHREIHVLDLAARARAGKSISVREARDTGLSLGGRSNHLMIDEQAKADYKARIKELEADLESAEAAGDVEAAAKARLELEALVDQLASSYGLGGAIRRTPDEVERARKAVTRRVRDALSRIEGAHPALGRHLRTSLRTGVFCSYEPDRDVTWTIDRE